MMRIKLNFGLREMIYWRRLVWVVLVFGRFLSGCSWRSGWWVWSRVVGCGCWNGVVMLEGGVGWWWWWWWWWGLYWVVVFCRCFVDCGLLVRDWLWELIFFLILFLLDFYIDVECWCGLLLVFVVRLVCFCLNWDFRIGYFDI